MARAQIDFDLAFHALSDPTRRAMVERLSRGPASVKELAGPGEIALPSALKHLKVLEAGGLVISEKAGRVRTYELRPQSLDQIEAWVGKRKQAMNRAFDRLGQMLAEEEAEGK
jgi:DNA-binding transcriptional ArsR family regulator